MGATRQAALLRIYTDETAQVGDRPLFELLVQRAREARLAGATVLRGRLGYGHSLLLHAHRSFDFEEDLPLVVEIVDDEAALRRFAATLGDLHKIGLVTLERVEVLQSSRGGVEG